MGSLDKHYGDNASLDDMTRQSIEGFLAVQAGSGNASSGNTSSGTKAGGCRASPPASGSRASTTRCPGLTGEMPG